MINRLFRLNGIKARFFFWTFILLVFISCSYVLIVIVLDQHNRLIEVEDNLTFKVKNQQSILENWAEDRAEEIRLFANLPGSQNRDLEAQVKRFKYFHNYHDQLDSIVFVDKDGHVKIDTALDQPIIEKSTVTLDERPYFKAAKNGKEYMHDVIISKATGHPVFIFSAPTYNDQNEFQGLIFGAVHLEKINNMLQETIQEDEAQVMLINEEGKVISHLLRNNEQDNEYTYESDAYTHLFETLKESNESFLLYEDQAGSESFLASTTLFDDRYYLVYQVSKREVLASHYQIITSMIAIAIIMIILGFVIITRLSDRVLQSFMHLAQALQQVKLGEYQTQINEQYYKKSPTECQQIAQGFNEMSASIQKKKRALERLSTTDDLTKIPNRRKFEQYLNIQWQLAIEKRTPIALIFIDVDHFKQYNDLFGHQQGDRCLRKIAQTLKSFANHKSYFMARYGGEEFVMILPNTSIEKAENMAEKVRYKVRDLQIRRKPEGMVNDDQRGKYITVSLGVAAIIPDSSTVKETLIQLADQALYEAKSNGRNRVVVHQINK